MKRGRSFSVAVVAVGLLFAAVFTTASAESVEGLMSSGNMLLSNGAYDQAVSKFRKLLARDPGNFEAQFNLAFAYLNWGRHSNAVTEFKKAAGINPGSAETWSNLAMAYEALGKSDMALNALYRAVENNPGNVQARMNLATVYANNGRRGKAIAQYKQVVEIDGSNVDANVNLGKCLISEGKITDAKRYLKAAIALNPSEAEAYWELGNIAWNNDKNAEEAIKNYRKATALQPNSQVYYDNLGRLLEHQKMTDEAIEVWKKYLVYLDDALRKEEIQDRVAALERGESPTGEVAPEKLFGSTDSKDGLESLRSEMRGEEVDSGGGERITVESYDVLGDLQGLEEQEEEESAFEFDMKRAVRKKKKENRARASE